MRAVMLMVLMVLVVQMLPKFTVQQIIALYHVRMATWGMPLRGYTAITAQHLWCHVKMQSAIRSFIM